MSPARWSGRFSKKTDPLAQDFLQSVEFDKKLYYYDILGSMAHVRGLTHAKVLSGRERDRILKGLRAVLQDFASGRISFQEELEDVHRNIESALQKKIGPLAGKLHTGRSRNDQVALDLKLYCRDRLAETHDSLVTLQKGALKLARENLEVIIPGYTHLRRAQPVLLAHHLLAYVEMWERDRTRILECFRRMDTCPLGAGALAGTGFPIDRTRVARELGFREAARNSLDAVSDRDFAIEIASVGSLLMMHLSRLSEELILWSSTEFGFINLPESFCTGSSMMPQKMNPDLLELVRGKTGRVFGHLISLLTLMKGLPLSYNRDLQEDKEALFDLFETLINCLDVLTVMIPQISINRDRLREILSDGFLLATDVADWLVRKGLDFRSSHEAVSRLIRYASDKGKRLEELTVTEFQKFSPRFDRTIFRILHPETSLRNRRSLGGTAPENVSRELKRWEARIASLSIQR